MQIPNNLVQCLVRNDAANISAVDNRLFDRVVLDPAAAVTSLFTIWDPARTFQDWAQTNPFKKAEALAAGFVVDVPVLVSAARRGNTGVGTPTDLIVVEGNHRLVALALRVSWKLRLPGCVGVFVQQ